MINGLITAVTSATCAKEGEVCGFEMAGACCEGFVCYEETACIKEGVVITPYAFVEGAGDFPPSKTPLTFVQSSGQGSF